MRTQPTQGGRANRAHSRNEARNTLRTAARVGDGMGLPHGNHSMPNIELRRREIPSSVARSGPRAWLASRG
eukprot:scaffold1273_cov401-Prasinococcus_capsulatus_cf.AAC.9